MHQTSKVLVVVDPSKNAQQASVQLGANIAKAFDRAVELLIVHTDREFTDLRVKSHTGWDTARHKIVNNHADHLEGIAAILSVQGIDVSLSVVCDWPLDEGIVRHTLYTSPYVVVKENHYHSKIRRAFLSYTDWNLIRNCPAPLWLAKSDGMKDGSSILACIDPNRSDDGDASLDGKILSTAIEIAGKLNRTTHAFHAMRPAYDVGMPEMVTTVAHGNGQAQDFLQYQEAQLKNFLEPYNLDPAVIHTVTGTPELELPNVAQSANAGLVVMGAIARNWLGRVFIGSTAEKVLDKLEADVLVLKPNGFVCPVDALSHADAKSDPLGHIFQVKSGTRKEWAANRLKAKP